MKNISHRARWAVTAAITAVVVAGCTSFKDQILQPQNPGIVDASAVGSPAAAAALKVGAMGRLKNLVNNAGGETVWEEGGMLTDEFSNADFQNCRNDVDARTMDPNNCVNNYSTVTQSRGFIRDAIVAEQTFEPTKTADIGELYLALGFIEMQLAEDYCNGIPLGSNKAGVVDYSGPEFTPKTNAEVYTLAAAHIDSGLAIVGSAADAGSAFIRQALLITKARILVDQGSFTAAAALVPTSVIGTTYQYLFTSATSSNNDDLGIWSLNNSVARITVSDSVQTYSGTSFNNVNALPFASANDPRVPVIPGGKAAPVIAPEDGITPLFLQQIWKGRDDAIAMVAGIDARMIEAEAKLSGGDIAGMMTILNAARAAPPKLGGVLQPAAMPALATPATKDAATTLFFREKAFWTFGRGQRLGDERRLIRQYGRAQENVFPTGTHFKGTKYGTDVNFTVPDAELVNPQFKGCIDRKA